MGWELEVFMCDDDLRLYLEALDLSMVETMSLFRLLDADDSGEVDIDEFCEGCLRLKGEAKSFDIHCLMYENQRMLGVWKEFMAFVEEHLDNGLGEDSTTPANAGARPWTINTNLC